MSNFAGLQIDEMTVRRAQRGDSAALTEVFESFAPAVYTLALRLCQSEALADDLTQETFMTVMKSLPKFRFEASLATWIRRIAVSRCLMHLRSAWAQKSSPIDEQPEIESAAMGPGQAIEMQNDMGAALGALSPTARTVVWLYDVEGYAHAEIAEMMDKTVSFSKSCLSRAHRQLRDLLEPTSGINKPATSEPVKRCSL
ncbi:MAG: RNA polymerase sigma factor [Woeseiaceae bacterium]